MRASVERRRIKVSLCPRMIKDTKRDKRTELRFNLAVKYFLSSFVVPFTAPGELLLPYPRGTERIALFAVSRETNVSVLRPLTLPLRFTMLCYRFKGSVVTVIRSREIELQKDSPRTRCGSSRAVQDAYEASVYPESSRFA